MALNENNCFVFIFHKWKISKHRLKGSSLKDKERKKKVVLLMWLYKLHTETKGRNNDPTSGTDFARLVFFIDQILPKEND